MKAQVSIVHDLKENTYYYLLTRCNTNDMADIDVDISIIMEIVFLVKKHKILFMVYSDFDDIKKLHNDIITFNIGYNFSKTQSDMILVKWYMDFILKSSFSADYKILKENKGDIYAISNNNSKK